MRQFTALTEVAVRTQQANVRYPIAAASRKWYPVIDMITRAYIYPAVETLSLLMRVKTIDFIKVMRSYSLQFYSAAALLIIRHLVFVALSPMSKVRCLLLAIVSVGITLYLPVFLRMIESIAPTVFSVLAGVALMELLRSLAKLFTMLLIIRLMPFAQLILVLISIAAIIRAFAGFTPVEKTIFSTFVSIPKFRCSRKSFAALSTGLIGKQRQLNILRGLGRIIHSSQLHFVDSFPRWLQHAGVSYFPLIIPKINNFYYSGSLTTRAKCGT